MAALLAGCQGVTASRPPVDLTEGSAPPRGKADEIKQPHTVLSVTSNAGYCAVIAPKGQSSGAVKCWASSSESPLEDGSPTVNIQAGVVEVATTQYSTCALLASGGAECWGLNDVGQLGNPDAPSSSSTPFPVIGLNNGTKIAGGNDRFYVLGRDGRVYTWGGFHDRSFRTLDDRLEDVVQIAANILENFCALTRQGDVYCMGSSIFGQLDSLSGNPYDKPLGLLAQNAVAVGVGEDFICVESQEQHVRCFGGEVIRGGGHDRYDHNLDRQFDGIHEIVTAGGALHACVLKEGHAQCWGNNEAGVLGAGNDQDLPPTPGYQHYPQGFADVTVVQRPIARLFVLASATWALIDRGPGEDDQVLYVGHDPNPLFCGLDGVRNPGDACSERIAKPNDLTDILYRDVP